jgi:hypothetical protein
MDIKQVGKSLTDNSALWGYFDFHKFLSFAIEGSVFFSRMDKMEDVNEGISLNQLLLKYGEELERQIVKQNRQNSEKKEMPLEKRQKTYFISCWLEHHRESVAMWNTYSNNDGIAIKVISNELINAVKVNNDHTNDNEKMKTLYHGKIVYKDFLNSNDRLHLKDEVKIIGFQKDLSFEHEKEYRFLIKQDFHTYVEEEIQFVKLKLENFKELKFDLIFNPKMEEWKERNIKSILKSLKVSNIEPKNSELQLKEW